MLLTNGCSFVWGDELEGCYVNPPTHHRLTFSYQLAELLGGFELVNLSSCGAGNEKIFRDTMVYLSDASNTKPTHMVILWSAFARHEVVESKRRHAEIYSKIQRWDDTTQFSPQRIDNVGEKKWGSMFKYYKDCHDTRTDILHTLSLQLSMQTLCDAMGIKLIQGWFHKQNKEILKAFSLEDARLRQLHNYNRRIKTIIELLRKESKVGFTHWPDMFTLAEERFTVKPEGHPDEDTHAEYAKLLLHIFDQIEN